MTELIARGISGVNLRQYYDLTKPGVVTLIVFTALVGMLLADTAPAAWPTLIFGLSGIGLAAAAGAVINHVVDQRIDGVMERTRGRPLPSGRVNTTGALIFAGLLSFVAISLLLTFTNGLTAILTATALIGYAVIYTMYLKRWTPQNIIWGGAAGAAPPLLGWTAVTGQISVEPLLLFLIVFVWTPPHFWPLALRRKTDYENAAVPMLPVTHGVEFTKLQIVLYTIMLFAVTLLPYVVAMSGLVYLFGAASLGLGFIYHAVRLYRTEGTEHAMQTFGYSIAYLFLLFGFFLVDHYLTSTIS